MSLLSVKQAGERLNVSRFTVRAWVYQGKLPYVKLGRRTLLKSEDLKSFIQKNTVKAREVNQCD